jgi:hypothetical protein
MGGIMNELAKKPNDPADGVRMDSLADKLDAELMSRAFSYGFTIRKAQARDFGAFEKDIDDADRSALSQTWRQDWRNELYATMIQSDHAFFATRVGQAEPFLFGLHYDREVASGAQVWMVRSQTFVNSSNGGSTGTNLKFQRAARATLSLFMESYGNVFNFFPKFQTQTIRWLNLCGLEYHERTDIDCPYVLCGAGKNFERLAHNATVWKDYLGDLIQ